MKFIRLRDVSGYTLCVSERVSVLVVAKSLALHSTENYFWTRFSHLTTRLFPRSAVYFTRVWERIRVYYAIPSCKWQIFFLFTRKCIKRFYRRRPSCRFSLTNFSTNPHDTQRVWFDNIVDSFKATTDAHPTTIRRAHNTIFTFNTVVRACSGTILRQYLGTR